MENNRDLIEVKPRTLEEKIDKTFKKIDIFAFNIKNINRIIAILLTFFIIMCFVYTAKKNKYISKQNQIYQTMLDDLKNRQLYELYTNVTPNEGNVDNIKVNEKPIFESAKQAASFAFNNLYNYSAYEIEGYGTTTATAVGQNVEIVINHKNYMYLDGVMFDETVRKETQTNFGQSAAEQYIYKNGIKYARYGSNIRKVDGAWIADFSGQFTQKNSVIKKHPFYLVTNQTIKYDKLFSFVRNENGRIEYYKATILLDPVESVREYSLDIQEQGGTTLPSFSYIELACIIDRNGDLMSYTVTENMTLSKHIVIDITTTTTNVITNIFLSYNTEPKMTKPILN